MDRSQLLPSLSMMTLGGGLIFIIVAFAIYWSRRSNRAPKDGGTPTDDGSI